MKKSKKIIIVGDSAFAEIAYEYFTYDSEYEVVAFSVESEYLHKSEMFGLPVVAFETLETQYEPDNHYFFVAAVYTQLNRLRTRLYQEAKKKGYHAASYISSNAFVWKNAELGEHCFIFEDNTVQPFVKIGNNVVLWSGNHIGHHSKISDNCFIASHVVLSGYVEIGQNCFLGVNATISNNLTIQNDCIVGAGAVVVKNVEEDKVVKGVVQEPKGSARRISRVKA